jgi:hypothetical protein
LIKRALELLHRLIPPDKGSSHNPATPQNPVSRFCERYLKREPGQDLTCAELWQFYREVVAAGELEPVSKSEFFRALPVAMATMFGLKKCHGIERDGFRVRGFRSITIREDIG